MAGPQDPSESAAAEGRANAGDRAQDPIVGRLRPDPAQPPQPTLTMSGFLGDSDRPGFRRLYFTRDLDYYAEFRTDDVLTITTIPADRDPFRGEEATRLTLRRDATVEYTRTRTARPLDEFDLDIQFGRRRGPFVKAEQHYDTPPLFDCPLPGTPGDADCPITPQTCPSCEGTCGYMPSCYGSDCLGTCLGDPCNEPRMR